MGRHCAHCQWSTCVEGILSVRAQWPGRGQHCVSNVCSKAMGHLLTLEKADGTPRLQRLGSPRG